MSLDQQDVAYQGATLAVRREYRDACHRLGLTPSPLSTEDTFLGEDHSINTKESKP